MNWQEWADNELADVQFIDNTIRESIQAEKEVLAITGRLCARIAELEAALVKIRDYQGDRYGELSEKIAEMKDIAYNALKANAA